MASALLGDQIDLHMGGEDLKFPHHQNEIAQSEAATGKRPFARYWMHRRHLLVDGAKMSKSKKNFFTLRDVIAHEGEGGARAFRYLVVTAHYATPIDFSWESLRAAGATLRNLSDARARFAAVAGSRRGVGRKPRQRRRQGVRGRDGRRPRRLGRDGGGPVARERVEPPREGGVADAAPTRREASRSSIWPIASSGSGSSTKRELTAEQRRLVDARAAARAAKDFAEADRLRGELEKLGVLVKDGKGGQTISFK